MRTDLTLCALLLSAFLCATGCEVGTDDDDTDAAVDMGAAADAEWDAHSGTDGVPPHPDGAVDAAPPAMDAAPPAADAAPPAADTAPPPPDAAPPAVDAAPPPADAAPPECLDEERDACGVCLGVNNHCFNLHSGNNLISLPLRFPDHDNSIQTIFADPRIQAIMGGRFSAQRDEGGQWEGPLADPANGGIHPHEAYWVVSGVDLRFVVSGIPDFDLEYRLAAQVQGLMNRCDGAACIDGMCEGGERQCDDSTNWVSFSGLASQRVLEVFPPEVIMNLDQLTGEGLVAIPDGEGGLRGSLNTLEPFRGYLIRVTGDVTFTYAIDRALPANTREFE